MTDDSDHPPPTASPRSARESAQRVARCLREAGFAAYFAGGCVRDQLLGLEPKDFDVATEATPEQICGLFRRTRGVGQAFGVVLVNMLGQSIEVTTFRSEGPYSDFRRPDLITYADAATDARRRDFTINGLFQDPESGEIIDYVGGREDLERRVIRAIGEPADRLTEDHLRMLRAVRFAARFGFKIEPLTASAIRENAEELRGISRERIGQEIEWMLIHASRAVAAALLQELGLDRPTLLEPNLRAPLPRLGALGPAALLPTALAAWWLDRRDAEGSPDRPVSGWREALMLSNRDYEAFRDTLERYRQISTEWGDLGTARRKRIAATDEFGEALTLFGVMDPDRTAEIRCEFDDLARSGLAPKPLVGGADLIEIGLPPGPTFTPLLEAVYDAQLEGRIRSRAEGLALARTLAAVEDGSDPRKK